MWVCCATLNIQFTKQYDPGLQLCVGGIVFLSDVVYSRCQNDKESWFATMVLYPQ